MHTCVGSSRGTTKESSTYISRCKIYLISLRNLKRVNFEISKGNFKYLRYCIFEEKIKKLSKQHGTFKYFSLESSPHLRYKHKITCDPQFLKYTSNKMVNNSPKVVDCFSCHKHFPLKRYLLWS